MTDNRTISINVEAVIDNLLAGMKKGEQSVQSFASSTVTSLGEVEKSTENITRLWRSMLEAFIGIEAVRSLTDMAKAANDANDSIEQIERTARNFGNTIKGTDVSSWLDRFSRSAQGGGYAIDELRAAYLRFATSGADAAQSQRLVADAVSLAAAKQMDLGEATRIVNMIQQGHYDLLSRYGIVSLAAARGITSTTQALTLLEKALAGTAETRAKGLDGALGRLTSSSQTLRDVIGGALIPIIEGIANAFDHFNEALLKINPQALKVIVDLGALLVGATAVALVLPALAKGVEIVKEGLTLMAIPVRGAISGLGMLEEAFRNAALGDTALMDSMIASTGIIAGWTAVIAGVIVALVELNNHHDHVAKAWHDGWQYMSDSFAQFTDNVKQNVKNLIPILGDLANVITHPGNAGYIGQLISDWTAQTANAKTIKEGSSFAMDMNSIAYDMKSDWTKIWGDIRGWFTGSAANMPIPHPDLPDGGVHKAGRHGSQRHVKTSDELMAKLFDKLGFNGWVPADQNTSMSKLDEQKEAVRHARSLAQANGTLTPELTAKYAAQDAEIEKQIALLKESNAQRALESAQLRLSQDNTKANAQAVEKAQQTLIAAHDGVTVAADKASESLSDYARTVAEANKAHTAWLQSLTSRVPGMSVAYTPANPLDPNSGGRFAGFKLDPMSILLQVIERSKSFADIMAVVNDIMNVFAQVIDALRPVIDALLKVILGIVEVFIGLWNVMTKVLSLFGIHVQQLSLANAEQNNLTQVTPPLIKIYHDLPTLAEYASGNTAPYSPIGSTIQQQFTNPIQNALKDTNLGGGLFGVLGEILGVLLLIRAIEAAKAVFEGASSGGGILGSIINGVKSIFGMGSSIPETVGPTIDYSPGAIMPDTTSIADMQSMYEQSLTQAVTDGIDSSATGTSIANIEQNTQTSAQAAQGVGPGASASAAMTGIGKALGGIADVAGIVNGFQRGGVEGGIQAGLSADSLALLLGATGGLATPIAIAAGVGALLFGGGPNWAPGTYPDRDPSTQNQWGQDNANLWGATSSNPMIANGQSYTMDPTLAKLTGGTGLLQFLGQFEQQNPQQAQQLLGSLFSMFQGENTAVPIPSGKDGNLTLANGQTFDWQTLYQDASDAFSKIENALQNPTQAITGSLTSIAKSITGTLDPFNQLTSALTLAGTVVGTIPPIEAPINKPPGNPPGDNPPVTTPPGGINPSPPVGQPPSKVRNSGEGGVNITFNVTTGDVHGYNDVDALSKELAVHTERALANNRYVIQ